MILGLHVECARLTTWQTSVTAACQREFFCFGYRGPDGRQTRSKSRNDTSFVAFCDESASDSTNAVGIQHGCIAAGAVSGRHLKVDSGSADRQSLAVPIFAKTVRVVHAGMASSRASDTAWAASHPSPIGNCSAVRRTTQSPPAAESLTVYPRHLDTHAKHGMLLAALGHLRYATVPWAPKAPNVRQAED